ncbi:TPA: hypothetical protein DCR49_06450 [Candidatus Delongbacteria bacterium]|nr:MAG: hypothetical protein A2Y39_03735 [Candidatus Delongbacteria bacterium GWF2_40_14]HAQ61624.1 hypothetical protein [Candidatus Delongbacteria bacterium]
MFIKKEKITVDQAEIVEKTIKPIAEKFGQEVVDTVITSNSKGILVRVTVGSKKGPMVSDLAAIAKEFRKFCEASENGILPEDYQLEVSSPGIDRELKSFKDFYWNEGRLLKILLKGEDKNINVEGMLNKAFEDKIIILVDDEEKEIRTEDIIKAKIKIKF